MVRGWWLLAGALVWSCSPAGGLRGSASSGGAPATGFQVANGASSYTTSPSPGAVRGGPLADRLQVALAEIARARGMSLTGDGRLADLATFVASNVGADGRPPASGALDTYSHHLGIIEPVPLFMIFGESHEGQWSQPMQDMLKGAPRNIAYNRFGISIAQHMGQRIAVVV